MANRIAAVGYVRCSTEMQEDSPEQQKKEIEHYASKSGYAIKEWFIDFGKSGTTFEKRPEFLRLKRSVESREGFKVVICYDESRWGRAIDAEENTYWRVYFRKFGVDVILVKTSIDPKHEFAPMLKAFEGVQASQYSKKLSELTLRGSMNNGIYSNGGLPPFGYKRVAINLKTGSERELQMGDWSIWGQEKVIWALGAPEHIEIVQYIFSERAKGMSYLTIAKALNEKGIPSIRQGRWKTRDQKWSLGTIRSLLENRSYLGLRIYNRNSMSKIIADKKGVEVNPNTVYPHWRKPEDEWLIVENAHPAIISPELWEEVQIQNKRKAVYNSRWSTRYSRHLLTGLIICSKCGYPFQGFSSRRKGHQYSCYEDSGYKTKRICSALTFKKEKIEKYAVEKMKEILLDPDILRRTQQHLERLLEGLPGLNVKAKNALDKKLKSIQSKKRNLIEALESMNGSVKSGSLMDRLAELEQEEAGVLEEINSANIQDIPPIDIQNAQKMIEDFVVNFEEYFEGANLMERKLLIRKCISKIFVDRDQEVLRFHFNTLPVKPREVENLLEKVQKKEPVKFTGSLCSGGRI